MYLFFDYIRQSLQDLIYTPKNERRIPTLSLEI